MDIVFLVKGKVTKSQTESHILYNGQSASKAFRYLQEWQSEAEITIEIFENGKLIETVSKNNITS